MTPLVELAKKCYGIKVLHRAYMLNYKVRYTLAGNFC